MRAKDFPRTADTHIVFAVTPCGMGALLVAQSPKGICAIFLGDDPQVLQHQLLEQFPHARAADADFDRCVTQVVALVDHPERGLNLPLDLQGTTFQQRVWHALRNIAPGDTVSYSELAQRVGAPGSARAVARACAANRIAVAIPCHRVVRRDGNLGGYRWGIARKQQLLKREQSAAQSSPCDGY